MVGGFVIDHIGVQTSQAPWQFPHLGESIAICSMGVPVLTVIAARVLLPDEYLTEGPPPSMEILGDLREEWDTQAESEDESMELVAASSFRYAESDA